APTNKTAAFSGSVGCFRRRRSFPWLSLASHSLSYLRSADGRIRRGELLFAHDRDEDVGNARASRFTEGCDLLAIRIFEEEHAAAKNRALINRLERARRVESLRVHHHFQVARLEILHAALQHDPPTVDEHQI